MRTASFFEQVRIEPGRDAFRIGDLVTLRADARRLGVITDARGGPAGRSYVVLFDGRGDVIAENLLRLASSPPGTAARVISTVEFRARLTARRLVSPGRGDLYSLHDGRVDASPHHYAPALSLLRADQPRLLLADDAGLGKSIQVGLILRELRARSAAGSVAIVCSRAVAAEQKWQREMRRFDESFVELDTAGMQRCALQAAASGAWPADAPRVILPFSLFDNGSLFGSDPARHSDARGLATLQTPPRFDLLIVDEAHTVASSDSYARQGVTLLSEHAKAVVYVTATPLELENAVLFSLLAMLRPDVNDPRAALLRGGESSAPDQTFPASAICRTRRSDLGTLPARRATTMRVELTSEQARVHALLRAFQTKVRRHANGSRAASFLLTTVARQAASCMHAVAPFLDDLFAGRVSPLESAEIDRAYVSAVAADIEYLKYAASEFLAAARSLPLEDPKLEQLLTLIARRHGEDANGPARGKVVVYSAFPQTLSFLARRLRAAGVRLGVLDGAGDEHARWAARASFARPQAHARAIEVLLISETGAEGLDLSFCKALVNYDLPLDPARIEERIARLERFGGDERGVDIYNLVTPGTIELAPLERVAAPLGLFVRPIGSNEALFTNVAREVREAVEDPTLDGDALDGRLQRIGESAAAVIERQAQMETAQTDISAPRVRSGNGRTRFERPPTVGSNRTHSRISWSSSYACASVRSGPRSRVRARCGTFGSTGTIARRYAASCRRIASCRTTQRDSSTRGWRGNPISRRWSSRALQPSIIP